MLRSLAPAVRAVVSTSLRANAGAASVAVTQVRHAGGDVWAKVEWSSPPRAWVNPNKYPMGLRKWAFNMTAYNQLGLYLDDCLDVQSDEVFKLAVARLPKHIQEERSYRISRANMLETSHTVLPKDMWVSFEEDQEKGRYLRPYIDDIRRELEEEQKWSNL